MKGTLIFVLATVLAIGVSAISFHSLRKEIGRAKTATVFALADTRSAEGQLARVNEEVQQTKTRLKSLQDSPNGPVKLEAPAARVNHPNIQLRIDQEPRLQVLQREARHSTFNATYAPLFREWKLSPRDTAAFENLLLHYEEHRADLMAIAREGVPSDPSGGNFFTQAETEFNEALVRLLGEEKVKRWKDYERSAPIRDLVASIGGASTVEGVPVKAEQLEKLIQLMVATSSEYQAGRKAGPWDIDWELVDAQAREILSAEQFQVYLTAESRGLNNSGSRFDAQFNAAANKAMKEEQTLRTAAGPVR